MAEKSDQRVIPFRIIDESDTLDSEILGVLTTTAPTESLNRLSTFSRAILSTYSCSSALRLILVQFGQTNPSKPLLSANCLKLLTFIRRSINENFTTTKTSQECRSTSHSIIDQRSTTLRSSEMSIMGEPIDIIFTLRCSMNAYARCP